MLPQLIHKEPVKFVGDLNPESVLTDLTQRSKDSPRISRVGIWVEQSRLEQEQFRRQQEAAARNGGTVETDAAVKKQAAVQRYSKVERGRRTLTGHQKNYLQAVGALRVLPKATQDALITTYVACIDPLFPIIDCKKLLQEYTNGEASVFLIQAMCLVTCKTEEAVPYLRLYEDGPLMEPIPFARALHTGLDAAMKADLEADRFTKVQIMTLMSLHNDGPGGIEESSLHLTMAVHDAQTTGLHINTPGRTRNDQAAMLWWTLWTLDKFNACLGGRPLIIADRDIDIERPTQENNVRSQTMAVWLAMGELLDQVIEYYRPQVDPEISGWEGDFPTFEELISNCSIDMLSDSQRNLLEISYNIIGILSCRAGGPTSRSYNRRIVSADRIQRLTADARQAHLPPIPLVPYAVSLSLTVAYRGLRDSHCDPVKTQSDLAARCDILESFSKIWWTADAMAKLGRKALKSIQQSPVGDDAVDHRKSNAGLSVGDKLEAEVAPCKFGPFNGNTAESSNSQASRSSVSPAVANGARNSNDSLSAASVSTSDRLQVLSHAAAQLGEPQRSAMSLANLTVNDPNTVNPQSTNINARPNKRPRYEQERNSPTATQQNMSAFSPPGKHLLADTPPSATNISTLTNTPAHTPLADPRNILGGRNRSHKMMSNPSNGVFEINPLLDPFCATTDLNPDTAMADAITNPSHTNAGLPSLGANVSLPTSMAATTAAVQNASLYNPRLSVPLYYSYSGNQKDMNGNDLDMYDYNDLDNLFDGFFDLSMPTMFEDPLFEGAAYDQFGFNYFNGGGSGGPSGAGSVDMSYVQQQQQQQQNSNQNTLRQQNRGLPSGWQNGAMNEVSH